MNEKFKIGYLYATVFITGAVILVIEITGTRVLAPFYGSTIFVWSSLITVTLGFLALGYFVGGFVADKYPKRQWFYFIIFLGGAAALLLIKLNQPFLVFSDQFGLRAGSLIAAFILFALPLSFFGMASPFAIRLRARDFQHTGHVSGVIFGVSTIGSLVGALLAGFYLIPNFFIESIFTIAISFIIITAIIGLLFERSSWKLITLAVLVLILLLIMPFMEYDDATNKVSVIHREPSFYGEIQVVEGDLFRCLSVNNQSQTCVIKTSGAQALAYGKLVTALFKDSQLDNALLIGLGGGILARDLSGNFQTIDVVEIDPKMPAVAKEFFDYDDSGLQLNTYIADGRNFIQKTHKKYDVVILDAFSGSNPIPHLYTKEAFAEMKSILSPDGMLVVNTIGRPYGKGATLQYSIFRTLSAVFPEITVLSTENIKKNKEAFGNIIFVAALFEQEFHVREEFIVQYNKDNTEEGVLLTDARNPIEVLGLPVYEESQKVYQHSLINL